MGYTSGANRAFQIKTVVRIIELVKEEAAESPPGTRDELFTSLVRRWRWLSAALYEDRKC